MRSVLAGAVLSHIPIGVARGRNKDLQGRESVNSLECRGPAPLFPGDDNLRRPLAKHDQSAAGQRTAKSLQLERQRIVLRLASYVRLQAISLLLSQSF